MIKSMTGYGSAKGRISGAELCVELKSVNNRHLDISVRIPRAYIFAEEDIKSAVSRVITRGKVDVFVTIDSAGADDAEVRLNEPLALEYIDALRKIRKLAGRSFLSGLPFRTEAIVAGMPDVLTVTKKETDKNAVKQAIDDTLSEALRGFDEMRLREGAALRNDALGRLTAIGRMTEEIERRSPETVKEYRERLLLHMTEVLDSAGIDEQRVLQEAAIYADKIAVSEETVRLKSHIAQFRQLLEEGSPAGRKLDFLIQEFNREANTCGSKCMDAGICKTVVDMKSEIEKIREQVQNIE